MWSKILKGLKAAAPILKAAALAWWERRQAAKTTPR